MSAILIVGLGNPGEKYESTRHNAGFLALDALAKHFNEKFSSNKDLHSLTAELNLDGQKIILAKPTTFMNNSGEAVRALVDHFGIAANNVWVISDDVTLPLGTLRVRTDGSAGGHNGLKSIIEHLATENFPRFKIGVDAPPANVPLEAWVLTKFSADELSALRPVIEQTIDAVDAALKEGLEAYGNRTL